jgi:hypothetical protein
MQTRQLHLVGSSVHFARFNVCLHLMRCPRGLGLLHERFDCLPGSGFMRSISSLCHSREKRSLRLIEPFLKLFLRCRKR